MKFRVTRLQLDIVRVLKHVPLENRCGHSWRLMLFRRHHYTDVLIQKKDLALLELICRLQVMERSGITALIEQAAEAGWAEGSVSLSSWQQKYYKEEAASSCYDIEW